MSGSCRGYGAKIKRDLRPDYRSKLIRTFSVKNKTYAIGIDTELADGTVLPMEPFGIPSAALIRRIGRIPRQVPFWERDVHVSGRRLDLCHTPARRGHCAANQASLDSHWDRRMSFALGRDEALMIIRANLSPSG